GSRASRRWLPRRAGSSISGDVLPVRRDAESSEPSAWRVYAARARLRRLRIAANRKKGCSTESNRYSIEFACPLPIHRLSSTSPALLPACILGDALACLPPFPIAEVRSWSASPDAGPGAARRRLSGTSAGRLAPDHA